MKAPFIDDAVANDRQIKDLEVGCDCDGEITWYRLPKEWTQDEAKKQLTDAETWFRKYCIHLKFQEFALDPTKKGHAKRKKRLEGHLKAYERLVGTVEKGKAAPEATLNAIQGVVEAIYGIIAEEVGKKRLVVLFLDEWFVKAGTATNRVSANHGALPLLALDRYDRTSQLMLVHELAHALRKGRGIKNAKCYAQFMKTNRVTKVPPRTWDDHYGGKNQDKAILHITRAAAFRAYKSYTQGHVFTVAEYLGVVAGAFLTCKEGCKGEEHKILLPTRRRERLRHQQARY